MNSSNEQQRWQHGLLDEPAFQLLQQPLNADSATAWIGRRLGAYRLVTLIGEGGMGNVYLADRVDGHYEQQVAIKLMRDDHDHMSLAARFKVERQILASLNHPDIAKVLDGGLSEEGVPYFVMELVVGEPIDRYCKAHKLAVEHRLQLLRTVCQAVHYAHQRGVVHRDLKPANILVTDRGTIKLVDFGIAKRMDADSPSPATATMQRMMTLEYASPEQVRGDPITPASDIFSLGVVLYKLLTDAGPYPASTMVNAYALSKAICDTEPPPPSSRADKPRRRRLKGDLDAIVLMALRKDPHKRYGLRRGVRGRPVPPSRRRAGACPPWRVELSRRALHHQAPCHGGRCAHGQHCAGRGREFVDVPGL